MKERPILFSGAMVRAILDGRKTQSRRIVKPQPSFSTQGYLNDPHWGGKPFGGLLLPTKDDMRIHSPHGKVGDRLWVRETWCQQANEDGHLIDAYWYRASTPDVVDVDDQEKSPWRPSIHMPRSVCRTVLEITSVRVERLNDISEADCWAEGIEEVMHDYDEVQQCEIANRLGMCIDDGKPLFVQLWQSINGPESWAANPWVWVIEFKRVTP